MIYSITATIVLDRLRWLFLLLFPAAFILSFWITNSADSIFPFGAAMTACACLIYRMRNFNEDIVAVWVVLAVFLSFYFLRYPFLLYDTAILNGYFPTSVEMGVFIDTKELLEALKISSLTFVVFCIVVFTQLLPLEKRGYISSNYYLLPKKGEKMVFLLLIFVLMLMICLGYLAYTYRIGQMGVSQGAPLPYRMKGFIFYGRQVIIPLLILSIIFYANISKDFGVFFLGILLLAIHGISDTLLRGTRSSLVLCLSLFVFLSLSGGVRIQRRGILTIALLMCGAMLLFPVIINYRIHRFDLDAGLWQAFLKSVNQQNKDLWNTLRTAVTDIYFRMTGIETVLAILHFGEEPLGKKLFEVIRSQYGVTGYLNIEIYKNPESYRTLFAPGFVGWLYLAWGWRGAALGGMLLGLLCVWIPRWLDMMKLCWLPVAKTFFLWILLVSLIDGTLDGNLILISVGIIVLIALEYVQRLRLI